MNKNPYRYRYTVTGPSGNIIVSTEGKALTRDEAVRDIGKQIEAHEELRRSEKDGIVLSIRFEVMPG